MRISASPGTCFDTETTGTSATEDRIVELGAVRATPSSEPDSALDEVVEREAGPAQPLWPSFRETSLSVRLNPQRPIPPEASKIHGIFDHDVADKPPFSKELGDRIEKMFARLGWVGGYNVVTYDCPLVNCELERVGHPFRIRPEQCLDGYAFVNWHLRHLPSRKLENVCPYLGLQMGKAHGTEADSRAAMLVIRELVRRGLIPDDLDEALAAQARCIPLMEADWSRFGALLYTDRKTEELRIGFGKHIGTLLRGVPRDYLQFVLSKFEDVPPEADAAMRKAAGL